MALLAAALLMSRRDTPPAFIMAYHLDRTGGDLTLYRFEAGRGGGPVVYRHPRPALLNPQWAAGGTWLYAYRRGGTLWRYRSGRAGEQVLPAAYRLAPIFALSPDGRWVAYPLIGQGRQRLVFARLDGSAPPQVIEGLDVQWMGDFVWSPDSRWLALVATDPTFNNQTDIYRVAVANGLVERLTGTLTIERSPVWRPDGQALLYREFTPATQSSRVVQLDLSGGAVQRLATPEVQAGYEPPRFSPDGKAALLVFDPRGFEPSTIYRLAPAGSLEPLAAGILPRWSPDGRTIAFLAFEGRAYSLYLMDADGDHVQPLARGVAIDDFVWWLPAAKRWRGWGLLGGGILAVGAGIVAGRVAYKK